MIKSKMDLRLIFFYLLLMVMVSCQQPGPNSTGSEYFPDMAHSIAYEANYYNYYYHNTWGGKEEYYSYAKPRSAVKGTIPRGYAGANSGYVGDLAYTPNGAVPYYYGNTEEERLRAMNEIVENPYPITDPGLAKGKALYDIYCGICHGAKGDGMGYLVREDGGKYPVQPANFLLEEFVNSSNGRYYHTIMFGRNKMGAHKDKLSFEERWQVIHYIRSLQAKELKLEYNQFSNTLNSIDKPAGELHQAELTDESSQEEVGQVTDHQQQSGGEHH